MKAKLSFLSAFLILSTCTFGQQYFDFYYTNVPKSKTDIYSSSFAGGLGWIYSGKYISADQCTNCNSLSESSKLKKEMIDSVSRAYLKFYPKNIYSKVYVPSGFYNAADPKAKPYMIKTLYEVNGNSIKPVYQVKVVFEAAMHNNLYDVFDIMVSPVDGLKKFDSKLILVNYTKTMKEEKLLINPPEIERLKN